MPTFDLDQSVLAICGRDGRFRPEAYHFLLEALDFTIARMAKAGPKPPPPAPPAPTRAARRGSRAAAVPPSNVTGPDLLGGFRDLALERYGALAREVLRVWGVTRTDDVGSIVFNMVEAGLLQKTASDAPADYHGIYDFESAFDRGFADRLRQEQVRLADRPPG